VRLAGRRVVVAGIATSGVAVAGALLDRDAQVTVVDGRDGPAEQEAAALLRGRGAQVRLGDAESPVDADLVVTSPGWRPTQPLLVASLAAGIEVIGEPELAWRLRPAESAPWLAVTGTNGKTTTVGMVESILAATGRRTVAAGNVGLPLVTAVLAAPAYDVLAVELSSFQLHWSRDLAPEAAAVLNLAEDHLDWHGSMDAYAADKTRIWQGAARPVGNLDDPEVRRRLPAAGVTFSVADDSADFTVRDGVLVGEEPLLAVGDLPVAGPHNVANALAAAALCRTFGVAADAVTAGLRGYRAGPHRNEVVRSTDGVTWVDDSKATNPHAANASLAAYDSVVWVAGGLLKGADVAPLVAAHAARLRGVVVIGVDRHALLEAIARHAPDVPVAEVTARDTEVMNDAVAAAAELAARGDTVLLAPAAASMDQFRDYADRGDRFAAAVRRLGEAGA
jgi:UDP-N-acetylmuramoylalanine--D-glutamate ligase